MQEQNSETQINPLDQVGAMLRKEFDEAKVDRLSYEEQWLKDLRQYKGLYDPEIKFEPNKCRTFVRLTRTKVRTLDARCMDMLFPASGAKNWDIEPTPDPEIPAYERAKIEQEVQQARQTTPTDDEMKSIVQTVIDEACSNMSIVIEDQLTENRYKTTCGKVIHSGHLFGTGVLKGPLTDSRENVRYTKADDGKYKVNKSVKKHPYSGFIPIWDIYPDMSVEDIEDCAFIWERHVMTRHALYQLSKRPSFNKERIIAYLREHKQGNASYLNHETELKSLNGKQDSKQVSSRNKFEVLERWGYLSGQELIDCGCEADIPDDEKTISPDKEYETILWMIDSLVIKSVINPTDTSIRPYHFYYFEKDETSVFGNSVPEVTADMQDSFNSNFRAAMDNMGITAGPFYEINTDLLGASEIAAADQIHAFRVLFRKGRGDEARHPAVRVHDAPSNLGEFVKFMDLIKQLNDETSTIPSYMHGETDNGVGKTVGGLSMLMGAANISIKDLIRHFDEGVTTPHLIGYYRWNMQFSDDEKIKGDYQVKATGTSSLVAKEIQAQQLNEFAGSTANPLDAPYVNRHEVNKQRAEIVGNDKLVYDEDDMQANENQMSPDEAQTGMQA